MSVNQPPGFVKRQERDRDAFLGGKLLVLQPERGFRAGLDSVLLGASVPSGTERLADLGAGAGVAALCALAHNPALDATLVEADPKAAALARDNITHNGFSVRARLIKTDVLAGGNSRKGAGLVPDSFDVVIANPPYFPAGTRAPDPARAAARHAEGEIEDWVRAAVSAAHARGVVIFIHLASALPELLAAFDARMGDIAVLPVSPRPGAPASRVLIRGRKGSRAPLNLLPPLIVHASQGSGFTPAVEAILRGAATLDWH